MGENCVKCWCGCIACATAVYRRCVNLENVTCDILEISPKLPVNLELSLLHIDS